MTYEELLEWVEDNAERYGSVGDMIAGIKGWDRLPSWVRNEIIDIWETFHSIEEEEPEEPEEEEYEDEDVFEEDEEGQSLFSRFLGWIGL